MRRTSYLALLDEQPAALARLIDVITHSALLSERLAAHPLLLDELLDARAVDGGPDPDSIASAFRALDAGLAVLDTEAALLALNELRQGMAFRIALATLAQNQSALDSATQLAALADAVLGSVLALAQSEIRRAHGVLPGVGFAAIAYGSVGGRELGFDSDLDLVFLHDARGDEVSTGARPMDAPRYLARLAQKLTALLGTLTAAGRLYEVDVRLRPDGANGVLVSSLASFATYQRERAWTWEQQALVRARAVAGDAAVCYAFEAVRAELLALPRDPAKVREEVVAMRRRMRDELDRSSAARFDLKQGAGGLVDLEFLIQAQVLIGAAANPALCAPRDTASLVRALAQVGALEETRAAGLLEAHGLLLGRGLDCTLDRRPRLVPLDPEIEAARVLVSSACVAGGLDFDHR